jgi:predicted regulator of Ras-like GTPase activity (Roadblock/LC7/MglB family)
MSDRAEKAFEEMLDISTDMDKAILFSGDEILASNFPENLNAAMLGKATELSVMGNARAEDMSSAPLTQLVVDTSLGMVFLVKEADAAGMGVLATGKKDSRIGLVFYDMKTCIRDAQEEEDTEASEE